MICSGSITYRFAGLSANRIMVHILDGNSEHVAYVEKKTGLFKQANFKFATWTKRTPYTDHISNVFLHLRTYFSVTVYYKYHELECFITKANKTSQFYSQLMKAFDYINNDIACLRHGLRGRIEIPREAAKSSFFSGPATKRGGGLGPGH